MDLKQKILSMIAFLLITGSIVGLMGTAGLSDFNKISLGECAKRVEICLAMLAVGAIVASCIEGVTEIPKKKDSSKSNYCKSKTYDHIDLKA